MSVQSDSREIQVVYDPGCEPGADLANENDSEGVSLRELTEDDLELVRRALKFTSGFVVPGTVRPDEFAGNVSEIGHIPIYAAMFRAANTNADMALFAPPVAAILESLAQILQGHGPDEVVIDFEQVGFQVRIERGRVSVYPRATGTRTGVSIHEMLAQGFRSHDVVLTTLAGHYTPSTAIHALVRAANG